ncbi:MscS mechanosensitive ion channel, partial [Reticulomyxa filosa]
QEIDQELIALKWSKADLLAVAREIRLHVEIKDRTYHFKKYEQCFLGDVCIKYFIDSSICEHVPEAIALGNALIEQNIIHHVVDDHKFENGPLFYAFVDLSNFDMCHLGPEVKSDPVPPQKCVMPVLRESTTVAAEEMKEQKESEEQYQIKRVFDSSTDLSYFSDDSDNDESLYASFGEEKNKR